MVSNILSEEQLGEELAAVDILRFGSLRDLRHRFAQIIEVHLERVAEGRVAPPGWNFNSCVQSRSCWRQAKSRAICRSLGTRSHKFRSARFRTICSTHGYTSKKATTNFSKWFEKSLGDLQLAEAVRSIDPYTHTEEGLRPRIVSLIERWLGA
jgi:hypothetical protein